MFTRCRVTYKIVTCFILVLLSSSFICSANADNSSRQTYIIELQNQLPETLIPTLKPLLASDDSISGFNNQLLVTTTAQRIDTIRQIISKLDKPLQNLLISVKNNNSGTSQEQNNGISGGIRHEKIVISTGQPIPQNDGLTVRSDGLAYSTNSTQRTFSTRAEQQIRAIEGSPAFIYTGESRQVPDRDQYGNPLSTEVNANKGFYVTARLAGDRVILDISTSNDSFDPSSGSSSRDAAMTTQHLSTSVSGHIGEWISLGGVTLGDQNDEKALAKKITTRSESLGGISVKISPIAP